MLEAGGESPDIAAEIENEIKSQGIDFDVNKIKEGFEQSEKDTSFVESMKAYREWLHVEHTLDADASSDYANQVEKDFFSGFSFSSPLGWLSMKLLFPTFVMVWSFQNLSFLSCME